MTLEVGEKHLNRFKKMDKKQQLKKEYQADGRESFIIDDAWKGGKSEARTELLKEIKELSSKQYDNGYKQAQAEINKLNIAITNLALKYRDSQADNEQLKLRNAELQVKICHLEEDTQKKVEQLLKEIRLWEIKEKKKINGRKSSKYSRFRNLINKFFGDNEKISRILYDDCKDNLVTKDKLLYLAELKDKIDKPQSKHKTNLQ